MYFRIRDLTAEKIGTLIKISGQVVRTHPVHPELTRGTFRCEDCNCEVRDVEQQFKFTQVPLLCLSVCYERKKRLRCNFYLMCYLISNWWINLNYQMACFQPNKCSNPACDNRLRFKLDVHKSTFVDFQKCRIQETQAELPRGSIPRRLATSNIFCFETIAYRRLSLAVEINKI